MGKMILNLMSSQEVSGGGGEMVMIKQGSESFIQHNKSLASFYI